MQSRRWPTPASGSAHLPAGRLMIDSTMTLPDGRLLAYVDMGPAGAPVVLHFHGAPGGRFELSAFEDVLPLRVVTVDRPGYGGSSPAPGRRLPDWPADVAALVDHLGVGRFAVTGYSSGGPYAVACAALLPDRVTGAGVLCGVSDFGWSGAWEGYLPGELEIMRRPDEAAATAFCAERFGADGNGFLEDSSAELAPADLAALNDRARVDAFTVTLREAFRQGVGGYAQDIVMQARPWAFDPAAIVAPVRVLHGEADTLVPVGHGRHTAAVIPTAQLDLRPEQGHISLLAAYPQLAASLH